MSYQKRLQISIYAFALLLAVVGTATCNLQPFSSVKVKASPDLYIPLGSRSFSAEKYFSPEKIVKMVSGTEDTAASSHQRAYVYAYTPADAAVEDKNQLRYLVRYPLQSFNFDFGSYFDDNTTTNESILSRKFDTNILIPKIRQSKNLGINARDINEKLLEKFNTNSSSHTISISAGTMGHVTPPAVNIGFQGFETITFDSNSYLSISTYPAYLSSVQYRIVSATLSSNGLEIPGIVPSWSKDYVQFPLDNKILDKNMTLTLTVDITGGSGDISIIRMLSGTIKRATGVNTETNEITPESGYVDMPLPENFQSATIGRGELQLSIEQPTDWTGITIEEQTSITQVGGGGLAITPSNFQSLNTPVSLAGKTLNNQPVLSYTPKLKVKLTNATYTYQENLSVNLNVSVDNFSTITLRNKEDFDKQQSESIPDGMKNWVEKIHFNTVSAKIKLNNGLPAGNPIKIKLSSTCFQMPEHEECFNPGDSEGTYPGGSNFDFDVEHTDNFDLTAQVVLPGYNAMDKTFTLHDVNTESEIKFSGTVRFTFDWTQMTIKAKGNKKNTFPKDKEISLSFISKLKDANMTLNKIPMYFYVGSDSDLLGGTQVKIGLSAEYVKPDSSKETKDLFSDPELHNLQPLPVGILPQKEGEEFTGAIPTAVLKVENLHDVLNEYPSSLHFTYSISMDNGITITKAQYEAAKNGRKKTEISVDILLDIPIGFTVGANGGEISLSSFTGDTIPNDFLGKNSAQHKSPFTDMLNSMRFIQLDADLKNESGFTSDLVFRAKNSTGDIEKSLLLQSGKQSIVFTRDEWQKLRGEETSATEMYAKFKEGSYTIKKDLDIKASFSVVAGLNIDTAL